MSTIVLPNSNASNLLSGTVPDARISGAYTNFTNITATGVITVNPGSATAPFIIGANGQGQLVTGLRAATADAWTTGRTISLSSDVTGTSASWTGSGNISLTATIANNAVTLAKMATVATARILGRSTAGTGNVEALTASSARTVLGLATTDSPTFVSVTSNLIGNVTGNSSTATTLQTSRTIAIGTGATGTATSFNGSANITIPITAINADYITSGTLPTGRISGSYTGITGVGTLIAGTWNGSTIGVAYGGTGATTFTDNRVLTGNGTSAIVDEANLTFDGSLLTVTGNQYISGNIGVGVSTPTARMEIQSTGTNNILDLFETSGTKVMTVLESGFVGIGTSAPITVLDVIGTVKLGAETIGNYLFITNLSDRVMRIGMSNAGSPGGHLFQLSLAGWSTDAFVIQNGVNERFRVTGVGNVGIGTNNPSYMLDIVNNQNAPTRAQIANPSTGTAGFSAFAISNGTSQNDGLELRAHSTGYTSSGPFLQNGTLIMSGSNVTAGIAIVSRHASAPLRFYTGGISDSNERMIILSGGNIGIGTTTPTQSLEVKGTAVVFRTSNSVNANNISRIMGGAYSGNISTLVVSSSTSTENNVLIGGGTSLGEAATSISFVTKSGVGTTSDGSIRLKIDENGFSRITGSFSRGVPVTKTNDFTLATTENWIINNKAATACVVTLPAASSFPGREITFKNINTTALDSASSNVVPLIGGAAGTSILTGAAGKWATVVSDGTNWIVMAGN